MKLTIKELSMLDVSIASKIEDYEQRVEAQTEVDDFVLEALDVLTKLRNRIHREHCRVEDSK